MRLFRRTFFFPKIELHCSLSRIGYFLMEAQPYMTVCLCIGCEVVNWSEVCPLYFGCDVERIMNDWDSHESKYLKNYF